MQPYGLQQKLFVPHTYVGLFISRTLSRYGRGEG